MLLFGVLFSLISYKSVLPQNIWPTAVKTSVYTRVYNSTPVCACLIKFSELEKIPSSQAKDYQVANFLAAKQTLCVYFS